ncbi:O-antigen ligase family protein [Bacillus sp. PS06]|uniref:O-antigen ligase family protein n=1 Tax=Bacillus sp. PS06 TaxID=2764176 RepID=UPI001785C50B|nr:O-antigen ligase family protein [Bacillus sp. PS06]MBD8070546.1 O-antigen ligase family protein [Bacillus sp. PS06]
MTPIKKALKQKSFEYLFLLYILLQPIIDIITSVSLLVFEQSFTFGTMIRFIVMIIGLVYLYVNRKQLNNHAKLMFYMVVLGLFFILSLLMNWSLKSPFQLGAEVTYIIKIVYFIVMFFTYFMVMKKMSRIDINWANTIQAFVFYSMTFLSFSMVIAGLTGTAFNSYQYSKIGHKGWFFAANELGAILSIGFPIVLLYCIRHTTSLKKWYLWLSAIAMLYSLFALGTKVGFGAILLTLVISIIMSIYQFFKDRKTKPAFHYVAIVIQVVMLFGALIYTPFSPIIKNTSIHIGLLDDQENQKKGEAAEKNEEVEEEDNQKMQQLMLSGRDYYLSIQKKYYRDAPVIQKFFGMGYAGNYQEKPKLIEMDLHDLFYSLGIFGFLLYILPFVYVLFQILKWLLLHLKTNLNLEHSLVGTSLLLGLGIAITAGHVITAPAVSIYLAIMLGYLFISLRPGQDDE